MSATSRGRLSPVTDLRGDIPLVLERHWASLLLVALAIASWFMAGLVAVIVAALLVLGWWRLAPPSFNLPAHAVRRIRRPDGAPRLRARRFRVALAGCTGVCLPPRLFFPYWSRDRNHRVEIFEVRLWPGEHPSRWQGARTEAVRAAFGAEWAEAFESRPGFVRVRLVAGGGLGLLETEDPPHLARGTVDALAEPVPLGLTASREPVDLALEDLNVLVAGVPGAGKSSVLHLIVGWCALDPTVALWLLDGKGGTELGAWAPIATRLGHSVPDSNAILGELLAERERRQAVRAVRGLRTWPPGEVPLIVLVVDELAMFTDTTGVTDKQDKAERAEFARQLTDLVRLGRADRIVTVAATQRPSADVVPTAYRDLVQVRLALRCTTREQSEIALGAGAAADGADATTLPQNAAGSFVLRGAGPKPLRGRAWHLDDRRLQLLVGRAAVLRGVSPCPEPLDPWAFAPEPGGRPAAATLPGGTVAHER